MIFLKSFSAREVLHPERQANCKDYKTKLDEDGCRGNPREAVSRCQSAKGLKFF